MARVARALKHWGNPSAGASMPDHEPSGQDEDDYGPVFDEQDDGEWDDDDS